MMVAGQVVTDPMGFSPQTGVADPVMGDRPSGGGRVAGSGTPSWGFHTQRGWQTQW